MKKIIQKLADLQNLSAQEASDVIDIFASNQASAGQIGAFLTALKLKGETIEEITGLASRLREKAVQIDTNSFSDIVDSCGTGGDCSNTFNISTASAILAASSGLCVAKHSNFGFTSQSGSSNVLQSLGIELVQTPEKARENLQRNNITFIHAPYFHKATASVNPIRKEIGIRTVFNFLGPLTNPAKPTGQVLGVAVPELCEKMAHALKGLGCKKALVVNGQNPTIDEFNICGKTLVSRLNNGVIDTFEIYPEDLGLQRAKIQDIAGSTPDINAQIIKDIYNGKITDAKLNAVVYNTAGLLWVGNKVNSLEEGVKLAYELVSSGKAKNKLKNL